MLHSLKGRNTKPPQIITIQIPLAIRMLLFTVSHLGLASKNIKREPA